MTQTDHYDSLPDRLSQPSPASTVVERMKYLIKLIRKNQAQFAQMIGTNPSNISKVLSGKMPAGESLINRIVVNLGVSKQWLVNGTDVPFPRHNGPAVIDCNGSVRSLDGVAGAPVYDIDVTAGSVNLDRELTAEHIIGRLMIPGLNTGLPIVKVSGNSMSPRINNGAYISIRQVNHGDPILWGQIYVVMLEDYRMVKYVRRHQDPDKVILHSENPDFDDIVLARDKIVKLFLVESILNYEIVG